MSNIPLIRLRSTVAAVDQLRNDTVVSVGREVEVPWNTVDLEKAFHATTFLLLDVLDYALEYSLVVQAYCYVKMYLYRYTVPHRVN